MPNYKLNLFNEKATPYSSWHPVGNYSVEDIEKIVNPSADSEKKIFTAIPSPFASFHMYDMAFKLSRSDKFSQGNTSVYDKMVSDVLDLFEIVFYSSIDSDGKEFRIEPLVLPERLERKISGNSGPHKLLAETIQSYFSASAFEKNNPRPFLLYWGNKLLGVTSPFTYFQPAFNLEVKVNSKNTGTHQHFYFDSKPLHIMERNKQFLKFFYEWVMFHRVNLSGSMSNFVEFFDRYRMRIETELHRSEFQVNNQIQDLSDYTKLITGNNQQVEVAGVPFYCQVKSSLLEKIKKSPMIIKPSKPQPQGVDLPIVLFDGWTSDGKEDPKRRYSFNADIEDFEKRALPDQKIDYPCLYPSDFIEEDIIRVKYPIDDRFYRLRQGNDEVDFLLPLKPLFFRFFNSAEINKILKLTKIDDKEVEITLKIPLNRIGDYSWKRIYKLSQDADSDTHGKIIDYNFSMAFFPLLRHKNPAVNNFYKFLLVDNEFIDPQKYEMFKIEVYKEGDDQSLAKLSINEKVRESKTTGLKVIGRYYYEIREQFDMVRILGLTNATGKRAAGMICPNWETLTKNGTKRIFAAMDFGTTNTHAALIEVDDRTTRELSYGLKNHILVTLNQRRKEGANIISTRGFEKSNFDQIQQLFFLPYSIDEHDQSRFNLPTRTVSFYREDDKTQNDLFGSNNIGFAFGKEQFGYENEKFLFDLKWGLDSQNFTSLLTRNFLLEFLYLIKFRIIELNGDPNSSEIIWFYPTSLSSYSRAIFSNYWNEIHSRVFNIPTKQPLQLSESYAPYFYFRMKNKLYNNSITGIIDIGGGSVDMSIFDKGELCMGSSAFYGANTIWEINEGRNFYSQLMEEIAKMVNTMKDEEKRAYILAQNYLLSDSKTNLNDYVVQFMNLWFHLEKDYNFFLSKQIALNPKMKLVILYYFSSIIYHFADLVRIKTNKLPDFICITGNGSKLLNRLDPNPELKNLNEFMVLFLRKYFEDQNLNVKLITTNNSKECTTLGGLELLASEKSTPEGKITAEFTIGDGISLFPQSNSLEISKFDACDPKLTANILKFNNSFLEMLNNGFDVQNHFGITLNRNKLTKSIPILQTSVVEAKYQFGLDKFKEKALSGKGQFNQTLFFLPIINSFDILVEAVNE